MLLCITGIIRNILEIKVPLIYQCASAQHLCTWSNIGDEESGKTFKKPTFKIYGKKLNLTKSVTLLWKHWKGTVQRNSPNLVKV